MSLWALLLLLQGLSFAIWAFLMFRTLFRLRARAAAATGSTFPGPGATLRAWHGFLTRPEDATDRRRLGLATLVMFGLIAAGAAAPGAAR